jgi:hypothetical protein
MQNCYSADEYLLGVSNARYRERPAAFNKRRAIMRAQRSSNDLALYLENAIPLPADGTVTNVISFVVPSGMDAIVTGVRNTYSGVGFQDGQGLLSWAYRVGGGYIWNRVEVGFSNTASNGFQLLGSGGALIYENQQLLIQAITFTGANASMSGGLVQCQVQGWFLPRS